MGIRRLALIVVTSAYLIALAVVGLWPRHVDEDFSVVDWPPVRFVTDLVGLDNQRAYTLIELSANLFWFVPFGVLAAAVARRRPLRSAFLAGLTTSGAIELAQLLFRPERTASIGDVIVNTLGTLFGAVCVQVVTARRRSRAQGPDSNLSNVM